jgi:hypothetical protein
LAELVTRLRDALGSNLTAVLLYGSAADHEFREEYSDLNVLCLLDRLDGAELAKMRPVGFWWAQKGHPAPLAFTLDELRHSADVFAIELLDMKQHHRMLLGDDFLAQLDVPMTLHRLQVERELRTSVIRLRQMFLQSRGRRDELTELMIASASTFATLFRHSLTALGEAAPDSRRAAADRLAARLGLDVAGFHLILDLREGKRGIRDINAETSFAMYLNAVTQVADAIDRTLAEK